MTKRALNMFELMFAVFFILKVTKMGVVQDWNWFWVFLPLILNFVLKFFGWVSETIGLKRSVSVALQDAHINRVREKAKNQYLKKVEESMKK